MNRYVLEILDGDQAGATVELGESRLLLGRKPDCGFVLHDEKCSGHHAEVVFEDGRHVLRDLGSTNGTTLDGRRVQEVVLSPRDVFVLGRIRVVYRGADEASVAAGGDLSDVQVGRVDAARLARTGKRRGSLVLTALFVLVVAAGGVFAWRTWFSDEPGQGPRQLRPMVIAGNRLPPAAANFEEDGGWDLQAHPAAAPFDIAVGRARANSGTTALAVAGIAAEDGSEARSFAIARLSEPIPITAGRSMRVLAHVRTGGRGRAMVRAVFGSGENAEHLRTGSAPTSSPDEYTELAFEVSSPRGADRVALELVALVPTPEDEVLFDDVALLLEGTAAPIQGAAGGTVLVAAGGSIHVDGTVLPTLLQVLPIVAGDPALDALARHGLFVASDAGLAVSAEPLPGDSGYRLSWTGGAVRGLALDFPPESASCRTRTDQGGFVLVEPEFEASDVRELLVGGADNRAAIRLPEPAAVRGALRPGAWRLSCDGITGFDLRVVFTEEAVQARELLREARNADTPGKALARIEELISRIPHDVRALRGAQELRAELLAQLERDVEGLLREASEAEFFDARVGYQRVIAEIEDMQARYGAERIPRADELAAARARMDAGLAALDEREGEERAEMLGLLADAFEQVGDVELARFVRDYVERHH